MLASLAGLMRTAAQECQSVRWCARDVASQSRDAAACTPLAAPEEPECAVSGGVTRVRRLVRCTAPEGAGLVQLLPLPRGSLSGLTATPAATRIGAVAGGGVIVAVRAVGLNFRDVLNVLGMYPGDPGPPGGDCSGVVAACGVGALGACVGDAVFGLAPGSLGTHVVASWQMVAPKPSAVTFEEASAVSTVYVTVDLALWRAAGASSSCSVLVHGATGGVGLAAVDVAGAAGVMAIGTAGSASKRALLRRLGVRATATSRGVGFAGTCAEAVPRARGVGVVLNSLTSAGFVAASLSCLAAGGRLVEIGKRDIWSTGRVAQERLDVAFSMVALDFLPAPAAGASLRRLAASLSAGAHSALGGAAYSLANARAAMRQMSKAAHVGKLVLRRPVPAAAPCDGVLLVGGLGALGSLMCAWLVRQGGVARVQLLGRSGRGGDESWRASSSCCVVSQRCDASASTEAADAVMRAMALMSGAGGLRCVMYAGGVLRDGTLATQTAGSAAAVFGSKVAAVRAVDGACLGGGMALSTQVLFSSVAALLGSAGQANYSAANAALDGWMQSRCASGSVGVSVQWGAWGGGAGMASGDAATLARLSRMGMGALAPEQGLSVLEAVLRHAVLRGGLPGGALPLVAASPFVWERFLPAASHGSPFFDAFAIAAGAVVGDDTGGAAGRAGPVSGTDGGGVAAGRPLAGTASEQRAFVASTVSAVVRGLLGADVGEDEPLMEAGLDSLGPVERAQAAAALNCPRDKYYSRFKETMGDMSGHGQKITAQEAAAMVDRFYEAQCVKDEAMGEAIADAWKKAPKGAIVFQVDGAFHSDFGLGTAERARRRWQDFRRQGRIVTEAEVLEEIEVRDRLDSTRKDAPLIQAADAHYVNTGSLTTEQVIEAVLRLVQAKARAQPS